MSILEVDKDGGALRWHVTVVDTKTNKVLYDNYSRAGAFCSAESVGSDGQGSLEGVTQTFFWGHPLHWLFCIDQLRQRFIRDRRQILKDILPGLKDLGLSEKEEELIRRAFEKFATHYDR